ncbi:MAG: hypothetical protein GY710_16240 [Desulfobacteraceae bacterium]|nr:hypothetical protein [Desulfobacteraceae bacterium]
MTTISGITPLQGSSYYGASTKPPQPSQDDQNKIVIEIKPGEDNVSSGDKSQNTAQISITTPDKEMEVQVSREEAFNVVERRTELKMAEEVLGGTSNNNHLIAGALAVKSGAVDSEELEELAYLKVKEDQIQTYANATNDTQQQNNSSQTSSPLQQYNDAQNAYMKQQLVFSKIDQSNISEEV